MSSGCTVQNVFQHGLESYLEAHPFGVPYYQAKAAVALRDCRTAALGGHAKKCPHGHVRGACYNSCRHRSCPLCSWRDIDRWLEKVRERILPTGHRHITCTLPKEMRLFWRYNKRLVGDLLLKHVRLVLFALLEMPKYLGAKPGLIISLHTTSRAMWDHIHAHCLITYGGVDSDGRWRTPRLKNLLPTQRIAARLKRQFTNALERLLDQGRVRLPPDMTRHDARKLISQARRKKWVVNRKGRYDHGHGVATYLARYIRGGPIKNQRILRLDRHSDEVTFRVSRRGEKLKTVTLPVGTFIGRVLLHVPRPGYRMVRSCGLYHHYYAEQLEGCRQQLGGGHILPTADPSDEDVDGAKCDSLREDYCPICGCLLEIEVIPRGPPPPELAKYWGRR